MEYGLPTDPFYQIQTISINADEVGVVSFDQDEFFNQETLNVAETRYFQITTTGNARVFSSTDITKSWNGDSQNNDEFFSSDGAYNYIPIFDNPLRPLQSPQELTGTVTLFR